MILFYGGSLAMTAMSVRGSIGDVAEIFAVGIADAIGLLTGVYFGEKNARAINELGKAAHHICFVFCGATAVILLIMSDFIGSFYANGNVQTASLIRFAIICAAIQCPLQALIRSRITYLQRIEKNGNMRVLILLSTAVCPILSATILGLLLGTYGVLMCYTVSDLFTLITISVYYAVKSKKVLLSSSDYLNLSADFNISPGDIISLHIRDHEDVSQVSEQIGLFCRGHKFAPEISYHASVCFEEMASNTITHGFPLNKSKTPIIDLRMIYSGDQLVMRLQDNCPKYDLGARLKTIVNISNEERLSNLGTWIVFSLADEIQYIYCYETNVLFMYFNIRSDEDTPSRCLHEGG